MFKLFLVLNGRLWWRSLNRMEVAAILFYLLFLLLIAGQLSGILILLLFSDRPEVAQMIYPGITDEVYYFIHLIFLNTLWLNQLFFTKINRLPVHENRKLLTFGMPVNKLSVYLNLSGFFHPVNLIFHLLWLFYINAAAESFSGWVVSVLLVIANYALIHIVKWRFRLQAARKFGKTAAYVIGLGMISFLLIHNFEAPVYTDSLEELARESLTWLVYTPGFLFYTLFTGLPVLWAEAAAGVILAVFIGGAAVVMIRNSRNALLTPPVSTGPEVETSYLPRLVKWLGPEGGKFVYAVLNHRYSKVQLLIVYLIALPFLFFFNDSLYITGVYLSAIPMTWILVMLTNMFGFENRELLLTLQFPQRTEQMIRQRVHATLKVCAAGSLLLLLLVPLFVEPPLVMLQFFLGILFVSQVFLHLGLYSCIENYKKIDEVGLMSVSNPVLPASITFMAIVILIFCGIAAFVTQDGYTVVHIFLLALLNAGLAISFRSKLMRIMTPFKQNVLPQLWNEL